MSTTPAIRLNGLRRRFGTVEAVRGISLDVKRGEIFAFLGPNGAGKTTTIRMMVGILPPTGGSVTVEEFDVWGAPRAAKALIGYVPDTPILHEYLTAREFLWFMADLYGLPGPAGRERTEHLLAFLELDSAADKLIRDFSLGMKRKMAIAAALLHRPRVLLLDEATNGLDARAARQFKDFLRAEAAAGTTVFLTTHTLSIAEELADRIGLIHRGELIRVGTLAELGAVAGISGGTLEEVFLALTGDRLPPAGLEAGDR
jgi:ABC-2 type transport system ATP-binding protein